MAYRFESIRTEDSRVVPESAIRPESPADAQPPAAADGAPASPAQKVLGNLLGHVPTEAVALSTSLAPLADSGTDPHLGAWVIFAGSLVLTVLVRAVNKASVGVWITSILAFFLWMALIPKGAFQLTFPWLQHNAMITAMIAAIFSAVITFLASAGKIK